MLKAKQHNHTDISIYALCPLGCNDDPETGDPAANISVRMIPEQQVEVVECHHCGTHFEFDYSRYA